MKEDYCSFEVAKLLKGKGFNEELQTYYEDDKIKILCHGDWYNWNNSPMGQISAPTHQMAMKWLREMYKKHCDIGYDIDLEWYFQIIDLETTVEYDYPEIRYYHAENETGFKSYEEAVEAALKYSLENLI